MFSSRGFSTFHTGLLSPFHFLIQYIHIHTHTLSLSIPSSLNVFLNHMTMYSGSQANHLQGITGLSISFFKLISVGVQLTYKAELVSALQQNQSVVHIHTSTLFQIFSHAGHCRVVSRVPCAIKQALSSYLFYI